MSEHLKKNIKKLWHRVLESIHYLYILVIIFSTLFNAFYLENKSILAYILIIIICISYVVLCFSYIKQSEGYAKVMEENIHARKSAKYADAMEQVHNSVHYARDAYRYLEACQNLDDNGDILNFEKQRFKLLLTNSLDAYSEAFTLVTGFSNRASIKVIGKGERNDISSHYAKTLARDSLSKKERQKQDDIEANQHLILNNTDYKQIFEGKDYCLRNNLPEEGDSYENTSFPVGKNIYTEQNWPLPYRSTIVLPIRYVLSRDDLPDNNNLVDKKRGGTLYGFLTIDCDKTNVYDGNSSIQMAAIVADSLFPIMQSYRKMLGNKSTKLRSFLF